jgi:hypothetical protein
LIKLLHSSNPKIWSIAFKSYVRPILEYASEIWNPKSKSLVTKIEKIQKFYTRVALSKCKRKPIPYSSRLSLFNLEPLSLRRTATDLCMIFKIINGFTHLNSDNFIKISTRPTRHHHQKQISIPTKSNLTENWLFNRSIKLWNSIPDTIIQSKNPKEFKERLFLHLFQQIQKDQNQSFLYY